MSLTLTPNDAIQMPQSKFGLGSTHDDMIAMLVKYFRVVTMIYIVWLIGNKNCCCSKIKSLF